MVLATQAGFITFLVVLPLYALLTILLVLKYKTVVSAGALAAYVLLFWIPALALVSNALLQFKSFTPAMVLYLLGDFMRTIIIPAAVFLALGKKPRTVFLVFWIALSAVFLGLLIPEQALQTAPIVDVRTLLRFSLLWIGCLALIVNIRRISDRIVRIIAASYCILSFFSIPFTVIGFIMRLKTPSAIPEVFFTFNQSVFNYYLRFCGSHLLVAFLILLKHGHGEVDLRRFAKTYALSDREYDIVAQMHAGHSNPAIGNMLSISRYTVRNHTHRIFDKCGVKNRFELIALIRSQGPPSASEGD
jgi:DNA-binding CsgD family transcriptional regulator